ncbi:MAG TPA: Spy/CpxP family protein refolding chaperone [Bryobacteraceae bacterium]|nr:Spy/CpxP family protein refolding chaperone [Bryobacteraceae bacterium]
MMKIIPKQLAAYTGVAVLGAVGLLGAVSHVQNCAEEHGRFMNEVETVLAMTPAQRDQAETVFEQARQSAQPIRNELMNTNKALEAAVHNGDNAQIQRLSTTEGQEIGQLTAIRSSAVAKVYKTLTPNQKQRADALQRILRQGFRQQMERPGARVAS